MATGKEIINLEDLKTAFNAFQSQIDVNFAGKIIAVTDSEYNTLVTSNKVNQEALYIITDTGGIYYQGSKVGESPQKLSDLNDTVTGLTTYVNDNKQKIKDVDGKIKLSGDGLDTGNGLPRDFQPQQENQVILANVTGNGNFSPEGNNISRIGLNVAFRSGGSDTFSMYYDTYRHDLYTYGVNPNGEISGLSRIPRVIDEGDFEIKDFQNGVDQTWTRNFENILKEDYPQAMGLLRTDNIEDLYLISYGFVNYSDENTGKTPYRFWIHRRGSEKNTWSGGHTFHYMIIQ